jgi:hypothetical protein
MKFLRFTAVASSPAPNAHAEDIPQLSGLPAEPCSSVVNKMGFRNGPLGVKPPSDDLATVIVLPFVVDTRVATSCHQMGAGEPI